MSNPRFDAGRAAEIEKKALGHFNITMTSVWRYSALWVTALALLSIFFFDIAFESRDPMHKLGFGLAFVVTVLQIVMLKLWFWIMNTKITLQDELKRIRAMVEPPDAPPAEFGDTGIKFLFGTRKRFGYRWLIVLFLLGIPLVIPAKYCAYLMAAPNAHITYTLTLAPDGSSHAQATTTYVNNTSAPMEKADFNDSIPENGTRIHGPSGKELSFEKKKYDWGTWTSINLEEPVFPGQWVYYTFTQDSPPWLKPEDNVWKVHLNPTWHAYKTRFSSEIVLPEGAELISATPDPARFERDGRNVLRFTAMRPCDKSFLIDVSYRLAPAQ